MIVNQLRGFQIIKINEQIDESECVLNEKALTLQAE
jgi:hypothetical protein